MNTISIPADPESRNDERAEAARLTVKKFAKSYGELDELAGVGSLARQNIIDLLANLAHMCDRLDIDLLGCIETARIHYSEETGAQGEQFIKSRIHQKS